MNVIVCCKLTPDPEDIDFKADGSLVLDRAEWIIGNFDLQAIEAGVRLVEAWGGKVTALSAGPHQIDNSKLKKDLLSRGPDELVQVVDDALANTETSMTAAVLAQAVRKIGPVDLVLCGEGSADLYFQQVGVQLGEKLALPSLNGISKIDLEDGKLVVERSLEDEIEVLEVPLPAVLSVTTDINPPRLPTMKEILKSAKKPIQQWSLVDLGLDAGPKPSIQTIRTEAPRQVQRKNVVITGTPEETAQTLASYLRKEGLI